MDKIKTNIRMVVCDMAGTTVEEDNLVYKTLQSAINQFGYEFSLDQVLEQGAGKEKKQAIRSIISKFGKEPEEDKIEEIFKVFLEQLKANYKTAEISSQSHAIDFFRSLQNNNIYIVLNTGYDRNTAETLLKRLGWEIGKDIDALVTADEVSKNRPYPDMIYYAMNQFEIKSGDQVVKVGDSKIDIEEGKNAGCKLSIGITTGAHTTAQLQSANPDYIVNNLMDILPLLN